MTTPIVDDKTSVTTRKYRIMFVINTMSSGGAERFTANMANHWAGQGHDVCILSFADTGENAYALHPGVQRIVMDDYRPSDTILQAIRTNVSRVRALRRVLDARRPDATIGIMTVGSCLLALAGAPRGTVRIGTERSYPPKMPLGRLWETLRRHAYGRLDAVAAQTGESADWLRRNTRARTVAVIPNPVSYPLKNAAPECLPASVVEPTTPLLISIGRLGPEKGFERLIEAFAKAADGAPDWHLAVLGEGSERARLEALVTRHGLDGRVHLPGRVGNVADWLQRADLFAMTSRFEGFPNALIEAMSYGVPAVSFDCDTGPRDVIRPGVDGLLVPQDDVGALSRALAQLMSEPETRARLAAEAVTVRDRFSMPAIAARWEALFPTGATEPVQADRPTASR